MFSQLDVRPGHKVLDIGCGTGKQTIPISKLVGEVGSVTAVDISAESLALLQKTADAEGLGGRIRAINCAIDDTGRYVPSTEVFDRAVACY